MQNNLKPKSFIQDFIYLFCALYNLIAHKTIPTTLKNDSVTSATPLSNTFGEDSLDVRGPKKKRKEKTQQKKRHNQLAAPQGHHDEFNH